MENESNNFRPQQSGDEQTIDIKQLIYVCISHWYLFLISVIVALAIGFVVNRYKANVYQTSGTVLIKDQSGFDPTALMTNLNSKSQNVENEMAILKSYMLTERTIKKMNLEVTYYEKGRVSTTELYQSSPFTVEFDRSVPQAVGLTYEILNIGSETMSLHGISDFLSKYDFVLCQSLGSFPQKIDVVTKCKQGEWIENGYNRIRIVVNENYRPETDNSRKLFFRLNSYPSLVQQMSKFSVNTTSKESSVASIVTSGSNPKKIVDFTNMLMTEYVNR